jgi:hypothetical protein
MILTLTQSYLTQTVRTLKPVSADIIELSKTIKDGIETKLNYSIKQKGYILTHKGKICYIKSARNAKFIHNWYVGSNEDMNINEIVRIQQKGNDDNIIQPITDENNK